MTGQTNSGKESANPGFSRAVLIILVVIVICFCALLGFFYMQANAYTVKKAEARDFIESHGGKIESIGLSGEPSPGSNGLIREFGVGENQEELWRVDFSGQAIKSEDLQSITDCDWIRSLDLSKTQIDDAAADELVKLSKLRELSLAETAVTDATLDKLAQLDRLIRLNTKGTGVTYAGLIKLDQVRPGTNFEEQHALAQLPIEAFIVDTVPQDAPEKNIDEKNLIIEPPAKTSVVQIIPQSNLRSEDAEVLQHFTNLTSLSAPSVNYPAEGKEFLTELQKLESIFLSGANLQDSDLAYVAQLPNLKRATLEGSFTDEGFTVFQQAGNLESLALSGGQLTPAVLANFQGLKNLQVLDLQFSTKIGEDDLPVPPSDEEIAKAKSDLAVLKSYPNLTRIKIYGNLIVKDALEPLGDIKTLKELELDQRTVTEEMIAGLRTALPNCKIELTQPKPER